ncbi:hypothetical protein Y1Q_0021238 [Alligator mississippiensis]|uniref:ribonuclease H n=1 Tax=Alligator mississippiensis TaxID=8496 RepID=A0A151MS06_ALLMI|nr:hypothetical protein Y1Q_0021238 [Alligator mississippiensis]
MMKVAQDSLAEAQEKQCVWYDKKARLHTFEQGNKIMVFLPLKTDKLQAAWEGPHVILDKLDNVTYVVARSGKRPKTFHVNMLKPYFNKNDVVLWISSVEGSPEDPEEPVMYGDWDGEAGVEELFLPDHLPSQDKDKLLTALKDFGTVFSNKPGKMDLAVHSIDTGSHRPIQSKPYPLTRRMDTLLDHLGPAKVISTLNLSKGFWQMALDPDAIAKSAFTTPVELYEFTVLPFDMRNSPASFQRLINNLLQGCEQFAMAYINDIAIFSQDFESHLIHLTTVLGKI